MISGRKCNHFSAAHEFVWSFELDRLMLSCFQILVKICHFSVMVKMMLFFCYYGLNHSEFVAV